MGNSQDVCDDEITIREMRRWMQEFVAERDWERFHNAKNLSMSLAIESAELMEHFQWLTSQEVESGTGFDMAEVRDELADVTCYALSLANALGIDLSQAVHQKMIKNRVKYPAPDQKPS
ncbi:MAG: nucleotide pyrophosphohydrolase [bacterium]|nr:nucleotide pyrophosphohydrolase [bacterium]